MNVTEARAYEEKTKAYGWVFGLTSIQELMHRLGDVQEELSVIHVAGTNGKGSVCCMLGNILQKAGYRTGRFQSPAVFDPLEVWSIDGKTISEEDYARNMTRVKEACDAMVAKGLPHPTTFEIQTALAFLYFKEQNCDRVILETGLGGSTDATNIISHPLLSVITSIGMDHMNILGTTIEEIAAAKAGIMKKNSRTVSADQCPEVKQVLRKQQEELAQPELVFTDHELTGYEVKEDPDGQKKLCVYDPVFEGRTVRLSLQGSYQAKNAVLAATAAKILGISLDHICSGLELSRWPGRFEQILSYPEVYVDGAHNEAAAIELEQTLQSYFPGEKLILLMGVLADKECDKILDHILPYAAAVYVTEPENPRKLAAEQLQKIIQRRGVEAVVAEHTVHEAIARAEKENKKVLALGSLYGLAETEKQIYLYEMKKYLFSGDFGVEKETLRVTEDGYLAQSDHPEIPFEGRGSISRDFGESQMEFISGVYPSIMEAANEICQMEDAAKRTLATAGNREKEYVWPYSNPPRIHGEEDVRIAEFHGEQEEKKIYREHLAKKYGKAKMLYSGVHFNYSFSKEMIEFCAKILGKEEQEVKNGLYLKLADQLMEDSWLIVILTAASPLCDASFFQAMGIPQEEWDQYQSFRSSIYGYWNDFTPTLDYTSIEKYCKSMERYVQQGQISSPQELYYPIRLKPNGANTMENIRKKGIGHMELRMLDLNPLCCAGVQPMDYAFLEMLCAYRLMNPIPPEKITGDEIRLNLHKEAAKADFFEHYPEKMEYARDLILDMGTYFDQLIGSYPSDIQKDYQVSIILEFQWNKLVHPEKRYANAIRKKYQDHYVDGMLADLKKKQEN